MFETFNVIILYRYNYKKNNKKESNSLSHAPSLVTTLLGERRKILRF